MIVMVVTHQHAYTIQDYLATWGASLKSRITVVFYDDLFCHRSLPRGAYIFTDLERLSDLQVQQADAVAGYLMAQGLPVLNRPQLVLSRYDLLKHLSAEGINDFRAVRLSDVDDSLRYPVFLRRDNDHKGPISGLIQNADELQIAVLDAVDRGVPPDNLLAVEFYDTADDSGLYRKYSAFLIGSRLVPRHILFSRNWVTKFPERVGESEIDEERHYLFDEPNAHAREIRDVFQRACINYGRIDYAFVNGRIIVWEINTNPTISTPAHRIYPERAATLREVAARLRGAFEEASDAPSASSGAALPVPVALREALGISAHERQKQRFRQGRRSARSWLRKTKAALRRKFSD